MSHIFISYSTKNTEYAFRLADELREEDFEVWIADNRLLNSDNWWKSIVQALKDASVFIVIMSPESYDSEWVQREVHLAANWEKPAFPLLLDGENFEIYVLTQFKDVRDGSLPTADYYNALREQIQSTSKINVGQTAVFEAIQNPPDRSTDEMKDIMKGERVAVSRGSPPDKSNPEPEKQDTQTGNETMDKSSNNTVMVAGITTVVVIIVIALLYLGFTAWTTGINTRATETAEVEASNTAIVASTATANAIVAMEAVGTANALATSNAAATRTALIVSTDWAVVESERGVFLVPPGWVSTSVDSTLFIRNMERVFENTNITALAGQQARIDRIMQSNASGGLTSVITIFNNFEYNEGDIVLGPQEVIELVEERLEGIGEILSDENQPIEVGRSHFFDTRIAGENQINYRFLTYLVIRNNGLLSDSMNFVVREQDYDAMFPIIEEIIDSWELYEN